MNVEKSERQTIFSNQELSDGMVFDQKGSSDGYNYITND
jgi:hypothetical protein